jgi:hypothetical protein
LRNEMRETVEQTTHYIKNERILFFILIFEFLS